MFKNREHAGELLAYHVLKLNLKNPFVIAIPRGGVETAFPIAHKLGAPLYVIIPRKIGALHNPEFAVGALAPDGTITWDEMSLCLLGLAPDELRPVIEKEKLEIEKRLKLYEPWGTLPDLSERNIILIDDGIATGQTVKAALFSLKKKTNNPIILAVPVLPDDAVLVFEKLAAKLIYLEAPAHFQAVGQFYADFSNLSHERIIKLLEKANR